MAIEIFRPGKHTAMSGAELNFSEADLAAMAEAYDPSLHEAPLVVGHPRDNAPAYGWVKSLSYAEGRLRAEPDQVEASFAELVNQGRFKKISASLYTPTAPNNPKPGVYYLRHVGFLGALPPSVKGLKDASFAENEEGVLEFGDWGDQLGAGLWRSLRDWIIAKFGLEDADKALPGWDVNSLKTEADRPEEPPPPSEPAYAEEASMADLAKEQAELKAQKEALDAEKAEFATKQAALQEKESSQRKAELASFAEGLVKEGKLPPTQKAPLVAFMTGITGEVSFAEGDTTKTQPGLDWFRGFLAALPKRLSFGEAAPGSPAPTADFAAAPGYTVDADDLETLAKAEVYQKTNNVSFQAAVAAVQKGA
jgi:hypothetical protein